MWNKILIITLSLTIYQSTLALQVKYLQTTWKFNDDFIISIGNKNYDSISIPISAKFDYKETLEGKYTATGGVNFISNKQDIDEYLQNPSLIFKYKIQLGDFIITEYSHKEDFNFRLTAIQNTIFTEQMMVISQFVDLHSSIYKHFISHQEFWNIFNDAQKSYVERYRNKDSYYHIEYLCKDIDERCNLNDIKITKIDASILRKQNLDLIEKMIKINKTRKLSPYMGD